MKTARELGLIPQGRLEPGPGNEITDVAGVSIGHRSLRGEGVYTGITAIVPHPGDIFRVKPRAAVEVINGFGKSAGLMQVAELGTLETPILLTNTFSVSACTEALIRRAVAANPAIGRQTSTVNAVVCECNDGSINDIQALAVTPADAEAALDAARMGPVEQGAVGAGSGMTAFGFKAGIGTASRRMRIGKRDFTLGTLVLANFGAAGDLVLPDGRRPDPVEHEPPASFATQERIADAHIDIAFRAAAETTQEAVLNALCMAPAMAGRSGRIIPSLADWLRKNSVS
ncbi:S58 family peptidase [Sinorhizobium medicae]|nr:S58 family peptidase [Sinorhizobium medicae]MDX0576508.1 S58 family peptidase [Sinorhizobium medicae]MDX0780272.1 S58 family peptidase [Sinorhizobium medicae]